MGSTALASASVVVVGREAVIGAWVAGVVRDVIDDEAVEGMAATWMPV